jgi:hypothetical protein
MSFMLAIRVLLIGSVALLRFRWSRSMSSCAIEIPMGTSRATSPTLTV